MKKSILNLGQALNKEEQKKVYGGSFQQISRGLCESECNSNSDCPTDLGGNPGICNIITCDGEEVGNCGN